jgi:histidyl-tRNA synthetase
MFEDAGVWLRTSGEGTEVVEKEMYLFEDRGGDRLALRPETTAGVCRAYIEHGMANRPQPVRLYYFAQKFRYDRPQAGRYRQHTEFGVEVIGDGDAVVDAEVIDLLSTFYQALGLEGLALHLNSIGDGECRPAYIEALRSYYAEKLDLACSDCRTRYEKNPLRLLDCKEPQCQPVIAGAPTITERLCEPCAEHFRALCSYLEALGIEYELDPRLVRGLDYYTRAVFEFMPPEEGAQSTVGGGGRYDGLIELLGGRPTPGTGFGTGVERIIRNLKRQEAPVPALEGPRVYVAHVSEQAREAALQLARRLRDADVGVVVGGAGRSLKGQLRHANALDARYAAILGDQELARGEVTLRDLRDGQQRTVAADELARAVSED